MAGANSTPLKELEVAYSLGKPCLKNGDLEQNGPSDLTPHTPLINVKSKLLRKTRKIKPQNKAGLRTINL